MSAFTPRDGQRSARRYEAREGIMIEFFDPNRNVSGVGNGRDLSSTGIRFMTPSKLTPNKMITLTLYFPSAFPGQKQVTVEAKVVRVYHPRGAQNFRVGCKFIFPNEKTKEPIHQYLYWMEVSPQASSEGFKK